ncbi:MAG: hypothetical protein IMZ64_05120 [Bacteroidetes bacterium]|nr:hypothetical protein [Bacteroidota bacterium]
MKTIYISPPPIGQSFSSKLLSMPTPRFCDDAEKLLGLIEYWFPIFENKPIYNEKREANLAKLKAETRELYVRTKKKEEDIKATTKDPVPRFFYYIWFNKKGDRNLFTRLGIRKGLSKTS